VPKVVTSARAREIAQGVTKLPLLTTSYTRVAIAQKLRQAVKALSSSLIASILSKSASVGSSPGSSIFKRARKRIADPAPKVGQTESVVYGEDHSRPDQCDQHTGPEHMTM
jgi:hypothetical protein